jgi:cytochrome P450
MEEPVFRSTQHWMLQQDAPDHTRLRGLVVKAFTARRVEDMRPRIQQVVDQTIDAIAGQGHADLIEDFAFRLPVTIICDMLGIPEEHREVFYKSSRDGGRLLDPVPMSPAEIAEANIGTTMAQAYFQQLFELRRRSPGDDLTTQLVQAEEDGSKLSNEELTANIILLFGAGHETTVNLIGNGLLALYRNPDQLALLKANPDLITNAIEEFLRYDSSVQMTGRVALEDIEDLGGKKIPKGESVLCLLGSANRDPAVYPDRPERLDITRPNVRPLSFGGGIHFCLGAQLARIEAGIAISTLLRRLPDLRLDDAENPEWRPTFVLRGLKALPASW